MKPPGVRLNAAISVDLGMVVTSARSYKVRLLPRLDEHVERDLVVYSDEMPGIGASSSIN